MSPQEVAADRSTAHLLKLGEVAERLAVSRRYLDELIHRGRLRAVQVGPGPKMVRVREWDLVTFCDRLPAIHQGAA